jgi:two-component system, chemotaxis family, response regulator Rcp1
MSPTDTSVPIRIAVVEDNPTDMYILQKVLEKAQVHFVIDYLEDGEEAILFLLRQGKYQQAPLPDLIILDLNMPRVSGAEVMTRIREDPIIQTIPVMVLTTSDTPEDKRKMAKLGVVRYLTKSSNLADYYTIGETIKEFLTSQRHGSVTNGI